MAKEYIFFNFNVVRFIHNCYSTAPTRLHDALTRSSATYTCSLYEQKHFFVLKMLSDFNTPIRGEFH
jgi:hypothetical protein